MCISCGECDWVGGISSCTRIVKTTGDCDQLAASSSEIDQVQTKSVRGEFHLTIKNV